MSDSDKSLSILCKHVRAQLVEVIEGSTAAGEDSQEMEEDAFPTKGEPISSFLYKTER